MEGKIQQSDLCCHVVFFIKLWGWLQDVSVLCGATTTIMTIIVSLSSTYYVPQCKHFRRRSYFQYILQEGHTLSTTSNTGAVNIFPTEWWGNWVSLWLSYPGPHSYSFICKYKKNSHAQDPWYNFFLCHMFSLNTWYGRWQVRSTMLPLPFHLPTKVHGWLMRGSGGSQGTICP